MGKTDPYFRCQDGRIRKLTPRECGRLQTIPEHILDKLINSDISNTQLYRMFGNGWTVEVIAHIFSQMDNEIKNVQGELL